MSNLLASTDIGTIFLSDTLTIKRFTPAIRKIVKLRDTDVGRNISDFASTLNYEGFELDIKKVLRELVSFDKLILTENHSTFHMRIHPYRRTDNRIDGVVITFVDITSYKQKIDS
jgi:two-component system CheB/CheR fusion protein